VTKVEESVETGAAEKVPADKQCHTLRYQHRDMGCLMCRAPGMCDNRT